MDKIQRATEIHRRMTPHQMALWIVEMEDNSFAAIEAVNAAREEIAETSEKFEEYNAKLDSYDKRITELQDALELADEAVRAKHIPDVGKMVVPEGWQLVPMELTDAMGDAIYKELGSPTDGWYGFDDAYRAMLSAAPKLGGE